MSGFDTIQDLRVREQSTWIELDHGALRHNLAKIISLTLPSAGVMAVVKANAYGHGLLEVAESIRDQVSYFGVASIDEALRLRASGFDTPILLFGMPPLEAVEAAVQSEVTLAISSLEQAKMISSAAERLKKPAVVHIKVDTGMGRLGIPKGQALREMLVISALPMLHLEGLFTHFPQGEDRQDPFTARQIRSLHQILEQVAAQGIHFAHRHAANSIGIVNHRSSHLNLVRPGIMLYGLCPHSSLKAKVNLKPVLRWRARIILLKTLSAGDSTGYGRTFVASEETTVGIVPVGYSHGYPFALSNKGTVLFRGKSYPVAGRISMDYLAVNLGARVPNDCLGDVVTLLGREGENQVSAELLAEKANTIPYEIVTQLSSSIPRFVV